MAGTAIWVWEIQYEGLALGTAVRSSSEKLNLPEFSKFKRYCIQRNIRIDYLYRCTVQFVVYFSNTQTNAHISL